MRGVIRKASWESAAHAMQAMRRTEHFLHWAPGVPRRLRSMKRPMSVALRRRACCALLAGVSLVAVPGCRPEPARSEGTRNVKTGEAPAPSSAALPADDG